MRTASCFLTVLAALPAMAFASRPCFPAEDAPAHAGKDVCIRAHVYSIGQEVDGTRTLDVCGVGIGNTECRFTVVSLPQDQENVGTLDGLRGTDIEVRGTVRMLNSTSLIFLSAERQLHGGAERFRPNPALLAGFSASDSRTAFRDPALKSRGHHGSSVFSGPTH